MTGDPPGRPYGVGGLLPSTLLWPMPSVLIQRCWPSVSATKKPSSTICGTVKCRYSLSHSSSSAISASQAIALV